MIVSAAFNKALATPGRAASIEKWSFRLPLPATRHHGLLYLVEYGSGGLLPTIALT